jgi:type IV pilus assembly protein PilE
MSRESGFTLVELMVVTAMVAILATVALPAYINYINRMNQGDAVAALMNAKMEQEVFYENNFPHHYAGTLGCLPSFNTTPSCLTNCAGCGQNSFTTSKNYVLTVAAASTANFQITAKRKFYSYRGTDIVVMSATVNQPIIQTPDAIGFSLFEMLFQ